MEIGNAGEKRGDVAILFPTQVENTQAWERNIVPGSVKKFVSLEENDSFLVRITI